jgi:hypothetical protein
MEWSVVMWAVGLVVAWSGFLVGVIRLLLTRVSRDIDQRFNMLEAAHRNEANEWQRIDRDLMNLRAELPLHYVRREDYIRGQSVIEAKLDALAGKIELLQIRRAQHVGGP